MDEFGSQALERFARGRSGSRGAAVRTASLYYLADRDAARLTWPVPSFGMAAEGEEDVSRVEVSIQVDTETWEAIAGEAASQGVAPEELVVHAIMYFLADLDSGRVAGRLDRVLDG
jgi:hypothetical protein